jgi:serine/threonine protein phosphatase 1
VYYDRYQPVQHLSANVTGRDYIVGDLHGSYDALIRSMELLKFDQAVDRMFSVGDLVDRGPDSLKCAELVGAPWFYATSANHESIMINAIVRNDFAALRDWVAWGGDWHYAHEHQLLVNVGRKLQTLPLVYAVGESGNGRFNVVHAEIKKMNSLMRPVPVTDAIIDNWDFDSYDEYSMLWGRSLYNSHQPYSDRAYERYKYHDMNKMSLTFVGHTVVGVPMRIQQHIYIDGGCGYYYAGLPADQNNCLRFAEPKAGLIHQYSPHTDQITTTNICDIPIYV